MNSRRFPYLLVLIPLAFAAMLLIARPHSHSSAKLTANSAIAAASPTQPAGTPPSTETDQKQKKPPKDATTAKDAPKAAVVPFAAGEILDYNVSWAAFPSAATLHLSVIERRNLYGWDTWHLRATGSTENPVRRIFEIDDEFDSYTDAATLASHQYEMYLNEMGKVEKSMMELTPQGTVPRGGIASVIVPPGTRDPIAVLQSMRAWDWDRSAEMRTPVFDGHNLYDVRANREAADEQVAVPAGNFRATKIAMHIYKAGTEMQQIRFTLWLAKNTARTPAAMEAELPFGTFRMELTQITQGK
jgi:Protein of unknown function (DUF3108)